LAALSAFPSSFALDAAEAVAAGPAVDGLAVLLRHHLLRVEGERYLLYDAVAARGGAGSGRPAAPRRGAGAAARGMGAGRRHGSGAARAGARAVGRGP